mmetsp:Transcript_2783/g.8285  ORF Transcript_2783/g.8285 Transcript_2783/m.8285 type:complete len:86 (-) Transcript_2783:373-630(-)
MFPAKEQWIRQGSSLGKNGIQTIDAVLEEWRKQDCRPTTRSLADHQADRVWMVAGHLVQSLPRSARSHSPTTQKRSSGTGKRLRT